MFRNPRIPMAADPRTTSPLNPSATDGIVCPFCAHVRGRDAGGACPKCTMEDTIITRRSTGERIGPWFVLQRKNPTAPGLRFSVLLTLARRGHVTGKSIVRGPTTGQLWRYAAEVKGLSRLFGVCWHCHAGISPDATTCSRCKSAQEIPDDPDVFLESHTTLPMMRELPSTGTEMAAFSDSPVALAGEERLMAPVRREPGPITPRRNERSAGNGQRPERVSSFDNVEDLTRALTLQRDEAAASESRPARRNRGTGEVILSASELAAAFQLNAPPPSFFKRVRGVVWVLIKLSIVLLIVLSLAAVAVGYAKPEWRQLAQERAHPYVAQASDWWNHLYARVSGPSDPSGGPMNPATLPATFVQDSPLVEKPSDNVPPTTPIHLDGGTHGGPASAKNPEPPRGPSVVDQTPTVVDGLGGQASRATPTTHPSRAPKQPVSDVAVTATHETPVETAKTTPPADSPKAPSKPIDPKPIDPKPTGHEMTIDEATAQATELRNSALDAEARRDWRAAVLIYEQIQTLPEAAWPSDLKVRLALAKDRLQGQ